MLIRPLKTTVLLHMYDITEFLLQEGTVYEDPDREDPTLYVSDQTGRGPLSHDWIIDYSDACRGKCQPTQEGKSIMCAYKLCKVEFRYWGMQSKIERFIHDVALRKTMLKAHSQVVPTFYFDITGEWGHPLTYTQ